MVSIVPTNFASPLSGNEMIRAFGVSPNGMPCGEDFYLTSSQISALSGQNPPAPLPSTATATLTSSAFGKTILLNQASGSTQTLPTATGSGGRIRFIAIVNVTSNSNKILTASVADFMQGVIVTEDGGTCTGWPATVTTTHSVAMNGSTTGGLIGDVIEVQDIAVGKWQVNGTTISTGTAATPFSTSLT